MTIIITYVLTKKMIFKISSDTTRGSSRARSATTCLLCSYPYRIMISSVHFMLLVYPRLRHSPSSQPVDSPSRLNPFPSLTTPLSKANNNPPAPTNQPQQTLSPSPTPDSRLPTPGSQPCHHLLTNKGASRISPDVDMRWPGLEPERTWLDAVAE